MISRPTELRVNMSLLSPEMKMIPGSSLPGSLVEGLRSIRRRRLRERQEPELVSRPAIR